MQHYSPKEIMDIDQVGLEKELYPTGTLSYQVEKLTMAIVKSRNAMTHYFPLQRMINLAGEVVGSIYLSQKAK